MQKNKTWRTPGMWKFGIGFWTGAAVYSIINMLMNFNHVLQQKILNYNYIITAAALVGLIINIIFLKRKQNE